MHMFSFSQPIIGCPLVIGKFCPKCSHGVQKKCPQQPVVCYIAYKFRYKSLRYIEIFL